MPTKNKPSRLTRTTALTLAKQAHRDDLNAWIKDKDALIAQLSKMEWATDGETGEHYCEECNAWQSEGHKPDCRLRALLDKYEAVKL